MEHKQYAALVLDMDGTLLDSRQLVLESVRQLGEELGFAVTADVLKKSLGCTSEGLMEYLGLADPKAAGARWREIMVGMDMMNYSKLFDGVQALLEAPIRRAVVTSQTREELDFNLARLGIADRFERTVSADDTPHCKPHPRPLLHCLEQMGISTADALFVGDSAYDSGCAAAAGVDFCLAGWGAEDPDAFPGARYILHHPRELLGMAVHDRPE